MTNSYYKISLDIHDHGSNVSMKTKNGDLYCITEEGATAPTFSLDNKGYFYYEIKGA